MKKLTLEVPNSSINVCYLIVNHTLIECNKDFVQPSPKYSIWINNKSAWLNLGSKLMDITSTENKRFIYITIDDKSVVNILDY